ncbi:hypothetical protein PTKU64_92030 (plasmid) [Paraburkholderia terrae]|uniref:Uncharacterized protein n=1 Tax=Paraburkholderia terrae TaxID=311230 RepID=A0ABM7U2Z3_9BURK|nr:hypothetical protein [Paraburkholderia terrae]BCZ85528.1 hypothetical protein PTKU64_92030 [Paraburkholderia terrae]
MEIGITAVKRLSATAVGLALLWSHSTPMWAFPKPKVLAPAVEAKWIESVKTHRTKDGATVAEVLAFAQKMRPREFKAGRFDVGYNGATGAAESVAIEYWIGSKRLPDDAFADLGYHMSPDGKVLATPSEEATSAALEGGRAAFLRAIDETYHETCRPDQAEAPLC